MLERLLERPHDRVRTAPTVIAATRLSTIADFSHLTRAGAVHRDDAAMGIPRFPARRGARPIPASRSLMERRGDRLRRARAGGSPASGCEDGARAARRSWSSPPTGATRWCATARTAAARGSRRADGRVLVPPAQGAGSDERGAARRRSTGGRMHGADRPRRLLAVRLSSFAKGAAEAIRARGHRGVPRRRRSASPRASTSGRGDSPSWDDVQLLPVALDRLERWHRPGLLAIGDAAHAMSPIGGIGINLAIQDAVAAANMLAGPLARGEDAIRCCARSRSGGMLPTRLIQAGQKAAQNRIIGRCSQRRRADRKAPLAAAPARPLPAGCGGSRGRPGFGARACPIAEAMLALAARRSPDMQ